MKEKFNDLAITQSKRNVYQKTDCNNSMSGFFNIIVKGMKWEIFEVQVWY